MLIACDGNTDTVFEVHNQSADTLYFKWIPLRYDTSITETETLLPGEVTQVLYQSTLGGRSNPPKISEHMDEPTLINTTGDTSLLELATEATWHISSMQKRRVPSNWEHRYSLTVTEADF